MGCTSKWWNYTIRQGMFFAWQSLMNLTYPVETIGSVTFLLAATLHQELDRVHCSKASIILFQAIERLGAFPGFSGLIDLFCVVFCRPLFVVLSFFFWPLCCLDPSSIYRFWLPLCYLQTLLLVKEQTTFFMSLSILTGSCLNT
jgi:hypothetical protein